jgi:GNAT superfamily N-acetyltransferase
MALVVRPGRHEDVVPIAEWTTSTFSWGDYVGSKMAGWIDDPDVYVMVVEAGDGTPAAISRAQMLSPTEGWLDAARVHPEHQRSGMGSAINDAGVAWAKRHGAQIVRLAVEDDNEAARNQVLRLGYRGESVWVWGEAASQRVDDISETDRLRPSHISDVDAAWMFWGSSDLVVAAHDLIPYGWLWKRHRIDRLRDAQASHQLLQNSAGWITAVPTGRGLQVDLVVTAQSDAPRMLRALLAYGAEVGAEQVNIKMPLTPWTKEALTRAGFKGGGVSIYAKT